MNGLGAWNLKECTLTWEVRKEFYVRDDKPFSQTCNAFFCDVHILLLLSDIIVHQTQIIHVSPDVSYN